MKSTKLALTLLGAAYVGLMSASPALAAPVSQSAWAGSKKVVTLPSGLRMAYVELGDPKGEPVLLLHGFTDSSRSWSLVVPQLERYRLLIPDQRGHGASDAPLCCYGSAQMAFDAVQFLDAVGVERASVAGHSMGSMVAIAMAAEYPGRVNRIALLGSTALVPVRRGDWLWNNINGLSFPIDQNSSFIREWTDGARSTDPSFTAQARAETVAIPQHVWRGVLRELTGVPVARHAADVKAPVLVLSGGEDPFFNAEHHAALIKAFPGAASHLYPKLGHNFLWEQPADVGARLHEFFEAAR